MDRRLPGRIPAARTLEASPCEATAACDVTGALRLLSRSHVLDILHVLTREATGPARFLDIESRLRISPNTLSERLRELVVAGLVSRVDYGGNPPRVEYEATAKARALRPLLEDFEAWARAGNALDARLAEPVRA